MRSPASPTVIFRVLWEGGRVLPLCRCEMRMVASAGVLAGLCRLETLDTIMSERSGLGETGETYLVSVNKTMLTTPRDVPSQEPPVVRTFGDKKMRWQGTVGLGCMTNYQSPPEPVIGVYRWIPELGVVLVAEQSQTESVCP